MKKIIILLLLVTTVLQAQDSIRISGQFIGNTKFAKVVVKKFDVGSSNIAIAPIKNEKFSISVASGIEAGVYRLQYSQANANEYIDLIINGKEKNIDFVLNLDNPKQILVFNQSTENKNWYDYQINIEKQLQKIELLHLFIGQYPAAEDKIINQAKTAYNKEKVIYKENLENFIKQNPHTLVADMVANRPFYFTDPYELPALQNFYRRDNYWNKINTNDPKLLNTPLYTEHILNYLSYYMNPEMHFSEKEMQEGFMKSADTIMLKFGKNPETKKFALKYLQLGFKEIGQEKVLQYIGEKYKEVILQCQEDKEKEEFEKRMQGYNALAPGTQAPEINFEKEGKSIGLKDITCQKLIIAFWASWCPHCEQEMPKLEKYILSNPAIVALAISLDKDKIAYENAKIKYPNLIHICDYKEWEGKAVNDYYIYGSPTFILLDKDRKIIGKFANWEATVIALEK